MKNAKLTIVTFEHSPITGTKIVEKEIDVNALALHDQEANKKIQHAKAAAVQFNEMKKQNTQRAKAITHKKQR